MLCGITTIIPVAVVAVLQVSKSSRYQNDNKEVHFLLNLNVSESTSIAYAYLIICKKM